jgi:hypothetical protein
VTGVCLVTTDAFRFLIIPAQEDDDAGPTKGPLLALLWLTWLDAGPTRGPLFAVSIAELS